MDQNANSCTDGSSGAVVNGQMVNGAAMDVDGVETMDYIDEQGNRSRKRKEPDSKVSYSGIPLHVIERCVLWHFCVFCVVILSFFSVQDDDGGATSINAAAKAVNPSSLFTSEGLQASYEVPDNIFDNSDESNDTVSYWF